VFKSTITNIALILIRSLKKEQDTHLLKPHQCMQPVVF